MLHTMLVCIIFLLIGVFCNEEPISTISSFNQDYIAEIKDEYSRIKFDESDKELSIKIGMLAFYFRIYKKLVPWGSESKGFEYMYPEPDFNFDDQLGAKCLEGLEKCIDEIFESVNSNQRWFVQKNQLLTKSTLEKLINNDNIIYYITASQILCFLSNSQVAAFKSIPYCSYEMPDNNNDIQWMGAHLYQKGIIYDYSGKHFECAHRSFCPNPCCSNVDDDSLKTPLFKQMCRLNTCGDPKMCSVNNFENDDLANIRLNQFNITCPCANKAKMYRPDIGECVYHSPCTKYTLCREKSNMQCVDTSTGKGYKCICQLGYYMNADKLCVPLEFEPATYHGFAHSEELYKSN